MRDERTEPREESFNFQDLVDVDEFSRLLERFFRATGIPNGLVGPDGELITQAGWTDACTLFHRANPDAARHCEESNLELMRKLREGEIAGCLCKNGLYDYATPIIIEGKQLATLFLGQVLNAPPDPELFRKQAEKYGFDESAYLDAIRATPIISKERMEAHMEAMAGVMRILAANGLARLRETRLQQDLNRSTERRIQMEDLLRLSPVGVGWSDAEGNIEYINQQFTNLFGYTLEDIPNLDAWYHKAYPDSGYRKMFIEPWIKRTESARQLGTAQPSLEANVTCKNGRERHVLIRASWVGGKRLINFTDMTAQWKSERRNHTQSSMLEMVAKGAPLADILHAIVHAMEAEAPSSLCSVLLLDEEGKHLYNGAAPSLPAFYNEAIEGVEIGDGVGSCGTAAFRGERVVVEDISTHDYWRPYAALAKQAALASCWSEPILASDGKVLGTFAIYHSSPAKPNMEDIDRIAFAANLAAIAIESQYTRDALIKSEREFRTLAENAPIHIARYDRNGRKTYINPRLAASYAKPADQLLGKRLTEQPELPFSDRFQKAIEHTIESGEESMLEIEFPALGGNMETHLVHMVAERDGSGSIIGVLVTGLDITERKRLEQELERQAHLDFLTGLINRRYFLVRAKKELIRVHRYGGMLSVIMFDIDHFKDINDTYGHSVGDLVLKEIARICGETVREIDIVGRLGGEEFVVLLPQTGRAQAIGAAERLRLALAAGKIELEGGDSIHFAASFGVVTIDDETAKTCNIDNLLIRADRAMYQAKEEGRNRVCLEPDS